MTKRYVLIVVAVLCAALFAASVLAGDSEYLAWQVIVKFKANATAQEKDAIKADLHGKVKQQLRLIDAELWDISGSGYSVPQAVAKYKGHGKIQYIEPNYKLHALEIPNDPRFNELWGLNNTGQTGGTADADIDAPQAWDVFTGSSDVLVVVIDTGIDYNHPDLAANIWTNPGEIPGNGIDDDGNGFIDDVHGYDFVNNDGDPWDDYGHGTHCAGTIGGVGNNGIGVAGVNWTVRIMACKFLDSGGYGSTTGAINSINYALTFPAVKIMSNSWGGGGFSQALMDAITAAYNHGVLFVCAAGNYVGNTDVNPNYPSCYNVPNVMSIGASDHNDEIADFSGYGATTVDIFAPGVDVLSTTPGNTYSVFSGTSMATPHTAGVAGLVWGKYPGMTCEQVKALIMNTVDVKSEFAGKCVTGGRLNALFAISEPDTIMPDPITDLATTVPGSNTMGLAWTATGDDGATGTASGYDVRYSTSTITEANFESATFAAGAPDPGPAGTPQTMTVTGLDFSTEYYFAIKAFDEYGNAGPISNIATGTTLGAPDIAVDPTEFTEELLSGETSTQTLTIYNTAAEGTLDFSVPTPILITGTSVMQDYLEVGKGEVDPRVGQPVVDGQGGPDATGYRWIDSDEPGGPAFDWVDITSVGTAIPLSGDDQSLGPYPIGFSFEFYEGFFETFNIATNGLISFTSASAPYSNQPLPNTEAPENLIAPFWDDLDYRTTGDAYYYYDGTRTIIEWFAAPHFSSGGPYTFEVILYPGGDIVFQYLTMGDPTNSATVGMQNSTKTDGLLVAYNTNYIHDNLAIRLSKTPMWLSVTPSAGSIPAGGSMDLSVGFATQGLLGGYFYANLNILSNDPDESPLVIPATLHVLGAPDIAVNTTSIDFGSLFVGLSTTFTLVVSNPGTDQIEVSSIVSDNPDFTVDVSTFSVPPREGQNVVVTFTPSVAALETGTLTITSNDPDEPTVVVNVQGTGLVPPQFAVTPSSLYAALFTGQAQNIPVQIRNNGGSPLVWSAAVEMTTGTVQQYTEYIEYPKGVDEPAGEITPTGAGGPDVFGYKWIDSDQAGGPTFGWIEISGVGTSIPLTSDDQNLGTFPIGFTFPFYTGSFSTFRICSNGWVSFSSTSTAYSNTTLPNSGSSVPKDLLAIFWDDLTFSTSGGITPRAYYYYDGTKTIIEFQNVRKLSGTGTGTYEIILYPNGKVLYQYLAMTYQYINSATIGIQNSTGTDGLLVNYNVNYVHSNLAILFAAAPEWLKITPNAGTIPAGGVANLTATFNATDMLGGEYLGAVHLTSNDPNVPVFDIPAELDVTGVADIAADPASLDFGSVFLGYTRLLQFRVLNPGTDVLNVHDIVVGSGDYTVDLTEFSLPPMGSQIVSVVFTPSAVGDRSSTLTILSDDPDEGSFVVPLAAAGIIEPDIVVAPTSLSADLMTGETDIQSVRIDNTGGSDLNFSIEPRVAAQGVLQHEYVERAKDEVDPNSEPQLMSTGGPDMFGYRWVDSDEPGGPVYDWVEISSIGTAIPLTGDDQNVGWFPIGFDFPFYGSFFTRFRAISNGFLSVSDSSYSSYSNAGLPSTGAGKNMIAPFWDDLTFTVSGDAYYYYDGLRTIIEYKDVPHYTSTGPGTYTFEVILYPSGKIVYQYQSMVGVTNSATIGIQNATGTDGLQVVYNAAYVHDGLAIELMHMPEWLSASPLSGTIPAGGFLDLDVLFDAADMFGGDYDGGLEITSNDPDEAMVNVAAHLHVTPAADIDVSPLSLDFGWQYIGLTKTLPVTIHNVGTDFLNITSIVFTNAEYSCDTTPFTVGPRAYKTLDVTYTPATEGTSDGIMSIFSSDPVDPEVQVFLTGRGVVAPEIEVDPTSLCAAALPGMTKTKILSICNTGGSDLIWEADAMQNMMVEQQSYLELGKEEVDPRPGILGTGGPDAFGYTWVDSDQPGGPAYDWVDISAIGTPVFDSYEDDGNLGPFPLGMDFTFYGNTFSQFRVCTNGWISFTSTKTTYSNQPLPNAGSSVPENLIAAFWDDMVVDASYDGQVYYYNDGSRLIVQYEERRIAQYSPPFYSYEIILYPDGRIVYQYKTLGTTVNDATIGIQNATRDVGLTVVYNASYVHTGLAIQFAAAPGWLAITPESGTIPAGECAEIAVTFSALALEPDVYTGSINIESNDLDEAVVNVPLTFTVGSTAAAYLNVDPNVINLNSNGQFIDVNIGLPAGFAIEDVLWDTFFLGAAGEMVVTPVRYEYSGPDEFGVYNLHLKFDREAVEAILPEGETVTITVGGEIDCVTYLVGTNDVRVIRPKLNSPNGGEVFEDLPGITENLIIAWEKPETWDVESYSLYFSTDAGQTWQEVATGLTTQSYITTLPEVATTQGLYRVYAYMNGEAVGYDSSDEPFTILREAAGVTDTFKPTVFALKQNWPNPFGGSTTVVFDLPKDAKVELNIFDVNGRLVKSLVDQTLPAGRYTLGWDGRDGNGDEVASGVYFYRIDAAEFRATKRMVLVK